MRLILNLLDHLELFLILKIFIYNSNLILNFNRMKTLITTLLGCLLYVNIIAQNAATAVWTDAFGLQDTVLKIPTIIDNLGNLYVAGSTINGISGPDIVIKKYDSNGDPVFGLTYSSAGNNRDQATTIAIDNNYNLIVGGFSYVNATNSYDFLVLKYDSAGTLLWTYTYNGTGSAADLVSAMALDGSNIYITGASVGISSLFDFTTIKLNSAGIMQWNNRYNYLGSDLPFDIDIIDTNIYVNGGSQSTMTNWDYALLHYSINGAPIDTIRTTGTGVGFDRATQAVTDNQGYIYITGTYATTSNGLDYKTIKFDQQGNVKWIKTFDNTAHQDDIANAIAVDFDGNVYITGKTFNSLGNYDYCTIKYDSLGTAQWTRFYDNKYYDEATSITVDSYSNVYVTGSSSNTANKDFTTIGYGTAGDTLWTKRFNGGYNGNDEATSIIEENGFVYVSGQTQINSTQYKNVTIAYGQAKIKEIPDLLGEEKSSNLFYIPNDGQLSNDTGAIASDVLFYVPNHYPSLFVNHHGLSYVFKKFTNDTLSNDTIHRIDMQFMRGNYLAKAVVYPNKITSDYFNNYYLPHCSNGVIDVRGSNMLYAKSLYEGIDLYYSSNLGGEKHYLVLAPNANPRAIKIKFNGADSVSTPLGKYSIYSSIGSIEYDSLVAYEIDALGNIIIGTSQPMRLILDTSSNSYYFKTITYNT
ncbi:MAG: SBBP repeat-containing protein, partial [Bacteroidota bacterium]